MHASPILPADLVAFDQTEVDAAASFARPIQPAKGIDTAIVSGAAVWRDGKATGARPGQVLGRS
jgi:N-acyl-D-amino-acid deacylase